MLLFSFAYHVTHSIVALLLKEKETITHDDVLDLIGPRPFKGDDAYNEYVSKRGLDTKADEKESSEEAEEKKKEEEDTPDFGSGGLTPGLAFKGC